jgi:SAM-dependent methyltransferase
VSDTELERIRTEYRARDARGNHAYRWENPGYVSYMQSVERAVLWGLADAGVALHGARVLDVGCGSGYFLHRLREYGAGECHGIDLMENRVEEGRTRYPALKLHIGSATELPFTDGEFDLVTQFTCLSSILDPEVRLAVAREMKRVAAGGSVLSFDMRGMRPPAVRKPKPSPGTPTIGLDLRELQRLFGQPVLLRREALVFDFAQVTRRHVLLAGILAMIRPLRSHLLGVWRFPEAGAERHGDSCAQAVALRG